jgi:hypothetical protein
MLSCVKFCIKFLKMIFHKTYFPLIICIVFMLFSIENPIFAKIYVSDSSVVLNENDNLPTNFFKNKYIPEGIKTECKYALEHFPELASVSINFKYRSSKFTMQTLPKMSFLYRKRSKRQYTIIVNNNAKFYTGMDYNELSQKAKIGWIGHELSHIVDFQERNVLGIIRVGVYYGKSKFRRRLERKVDDLTIQHGLGEELFDGVDYMLNSSAASENYKKNFVKHYLSLKEIRTRIKERKEKRLKKLSVKNEQK